MLSGRWLRRQQKQTAVERAACRPLSYIGRGNVGFIRYLEFPDRRSVEVAGRVIRNGDGDPGVDPFVLRIGLDQLETSDRGMPPAQHGA